jgi:hypothetical protein
MLAFCASAIVRKIGGWVQDNEQKKDVLGGYPLVEFFVRVHEEFYHITRDGTIVGVFVHQFGTVELQLTFDEGFSDHISIASVKNGFDAGHDPLHVLVVVQHALSTDWKNPVKRFVCFRYSIGSIVGVFLVLLSVGPHQLEFFVTHEITPGSSVQWYRVIFLFIAFIFSFFLRFKDIPSPKDFIFF